MDFNIVFWVIGIVFSIGIFAIKVGLGLSFGGIGARVITLILSLYLLVFVFTAVFAAKIVNILEPVLRKGPYLHALMAAGMIVWGICLLRSSKSGIQSDNSQKMPFSLHSLKSGCIPQSAILLIPCPVCITAMAFSAWAALNVIKLPALFVGAGMGVVFIVLSLLVYLSVRLFAGNRALFNANTGLAFSMIGIGLYFLATLYFPAKIEAAMGIYRSFATENMGVSQGDNAGVFLVLFLALLTGFFIYRKQGVKE